MPYFYITQFVDTSYPARKAFYYLQRKDFSLKNSPANCNDWIEFRDVTPGQAEDTADDQNNPKMDTTRRVPHVVTISLIRSILIENFALCEDNFMGPVNLKMVCFVCTERVGPD